METTAVMLLNSMMEEKEKSSINLKCVSIALLKRCNFSGSEVASLLEPHSNLLLDIIENESDLSLRMLAAEVLPKITSSKGLSLVLSQMKTRILALGSSEDDKLISNILTNNLLQLLAQKSSSDSQRLKESIELLLLIRDGIDNNHLYSLLNLVCLNPELQDLSIQLILENLPRGHAMPGFVLVSWYLLGEFGNSLFNSRSSFFSDFVKLMEKGINAPQPLRMMIISAIAKIWAKIDNQSSNSSTNIDSFKSLASKLFRSFVIHQDLETQSRASQYLFILQCPNLSSENKLEIFSNMPCKIRSQQFDTEQIQTDLFLDSSPPPVDDLLVLDFKDQPQISQPEPEHDPLDLFSTPVNVQVNASIKKQEIDPGLDLFMNSPKVPVQKMVEIPPKNDITDPFGLDLFSNNNNNTSKSSKPVDNSKNTNNKFDDMDLLSMGMDNKPPVSESQNNANKNDLDFDLL